MRGRPSPCKIRSGTILVLEPTPEAYARKGDIRMAEAKRVIRPGRPVRVEEVCSVLEAIAPPALAAEWDNVGLLIGERSAAVRRLLLTIDLTGRVLREARQARAGMVMAYHPVIFKPLARLTAEDSPAAYAAARMGLAVYSMHTALDAAPGGTNDVLAEAVGLSDTSPLVRSMRSGQYKVVVFVPPGDLPRVAEAAFATGAGRIRNYSECSFCTPGIGTFRGGRGARPTIGRAGRREEVEEWRLEMLVPKGKLAEVLEAVRGVHSYETPAVDVYPLQDAPAGAGMGRIGRLPRPASLKALIGRVKRALRVGKLLVAGGSAGPVRTVACCAGSGGSLFRSAIAAGAEAYVTGQMRHHDALAAAAAGLAVICVGHSNSERITLPRLAGRIREALPALKVSVSRADRDPFEIV